MVLVERGEAVLFCNFFLEDFFIYRLFVAVVRSYVFPYKKKIQKQFSFFFFLSSVTIYSPPLNAPNSFISNEQEYKDKT